MTVHLPDELRDRLAADRPQLEMAMKSSRCLLVIHHLEELILVGEAVQGSFKL